MIGVVACPNPGCRHPERLSLDPPGRVFRCRRCQTRIRMRPAPAAAVVAASSRPGFGTESTYDDDPGDWLGPGSDEGSSSDGKYSVRSSSYSDSSSTIAVARLGRYRVLGLIGEGRSARVYRAHDPILDRLVALKVPRPGAVASVRTRERFLAEARALARLRHPAIVPVFDLGRIDDRCYIAMGLIEGPSLALLLERGPMAPRRAAAIVADLAEALEHAHEQGVLHRDVKPANILTDASGNVHLTDFGLAGRPDEGDSANPERWAGTPAFAAPERSSAESPRSLPAGDQYSLGVVLYLMLCGRTPFVGPPLHILYQATSREAPSPRTIAPKVPARLAAIGLRAIARRPEDRFSSCAEFAEALRRWIREGRG